MRFLVVLLFVLFSSGCAITKQPAEPLAMPLKPALTTQTYQLKYQTEHASPTLPKRLCCPKAPTVKISRVDH
jgi:hypothetical protein